MARNRLIEEMAAHPLHSMILLAGFFFLAQYLGVNPASTPEEAWSQSKHFIVLTVIVGALLQVAVEIADWRRSRGQVVGP